MSTAQVTRRRIKGQRTAARILDVAEELFARQGYAGTSLRQVARTAGIREPGLYNHFAGKRGLYEAVLKRALGPLVETIHHHLEAADALHEYTDMPSLVLELLLERPNLAALFQQALQGSGEMPGQPEVLDWAQGIFEKGLQEVSARGLGSEDDRQTLVINVIAMFNLTTGYFLAQQALQHLGAGDADDPDNIERQKRLLRKVVRAMLIS